MKQRFIAFISLGFSCGGPEMGDYGDFYVNLSDDEIEAIEEIVKEETKGYKRFLLKERYPDLHEKIVASAQGLVRDVIVHDAVSFLEDPISEEDAKKLEAMGYHEQTDFLAANYDLEPDTLELADVCYYLTSEELPRDYDTRSRG